MDHILGFVILKKPHVPLLLNIHMTNFAELYHSESTAVKSVNPDEILGALLITPMQK